MEEQVSLNTLHRDLRDFKNDMDRKFENVNQRFENVNQRFDNVNQNVDQKFENVDRKFDSVNNRLNNLEYQIHNAQSTTIKWGVGLFVGTIIIVTGLVASYATILGVG